MRNLVRRVAAVAATTTVALMIVGSATTGAAQAQPRDLDWYPCTIGGKRMMCSDGPF
ncbi:hypothetical protein ABT061_08260 [Streptosporangium sp. NPDC002544]|uniref:hypothetical protein n=1 Tax=Streptosporangium sp. NPDC002544 TaxID=3154538 RepID=UPI00331C8EE1